ncbi:hybrid sensor histidine kinase/response regulator transcription factor [Hufsiella ginkgonis]|uniref:histidine kinase n=1 Tax=Hufsiella ginkgonis TaxID=2695274 RepID=A0A7K1XU29_9SPHI|nr:hybrid sensor histidine kinase/response regulator transcription factor [Hufsiella ginkgonis]MXV14521.1 response regulator [Hufsiella ginkgonis]
MERFPRVRNFAGPLFKTLSVILFVFFCAYAHAQNDLNFTTLSDRDGLSSNTVNAILKDRYGYMWFGTDDGLNKFDGTNLAVYRHDPENRSSIAASGVVALHEDREGNLWIGTSEGFVSLYDRKKDSFINYKSSSNTTARSICTDKYGKVWLAGYNGLSVLDPKTGRIKNYSPQPGKTGSLLSKTITCVFYDSKDRLWVGSNAGLHQFDERTSTFRPFLHKEGDPATISDNVIKAIAEDKKGNTWFGTQRGLSMLRTDGGGFLNYRHDPADPRSLSSDRIFAIAAEEGKLWVGTEEGLNILDLANGQALRITKDSRNRYSLGAKSVRSVFIDGLGLYWVGTYLGGVSKYDKNLTFFNLRQSNPFDPIGLNAPVVTSFSEKNDEEIYVGTDGGGLNLFHRKTGLFDHIGLRDRGGNTGLSILTMERTRDELWIGTYLEGLYRLQISSGTVRHYVKGKGPHDLAGNDIFAVRKDSRGNVWLGTNGDGVMVYDPGSDAFRKFRSTTQKYGRDSIPFNGFIRTIEEDEAGNIWIGSYGTGVAVYNPWRNTVKVYNRFNNGLPIDQVLTIHSARNGQLWVGTAGGGLCLFDPVRQRFTTYSERSGLANGVIHKILEDNNGKLWVSTNKGISSFDLRSRKFTNYSHYNGLQRSTFIQGAGLKTSNGELFFGGLDGFNFFSPEKLNFNRNVPSVVFTDLRIANKKVTADENSPVTEDISVASEIHVDYKQNFSLSYAALNFTAPQENSYSYKLEGFDKDWNNVGKSKTAVYTNLYPGEYTFLVRASSAAGNWTTPVASIRIHVDPPFWLTIYAFIAYGSAILLLLWGIRYRGIKKLKAKFALEQERLQVKQLMDQERREAEQLHEFDTLRIKFLTNLSHEFRTPVSLIVGPVERLLSQESNIEKAGQLNLVKRNARRLLNLVNQLLDFRKLEEHELKLNLSEGDIVSFARDVAESFKDLSERRQIHFTFRTSLSSYPAHFDRDKLERILFNLLSNAFKFTLPNGEVRLEIDSDRSMSGVRLSVSDTGVGISPEEQDKIFERFFQANTPNAILNQGSGIGLSITREFVEMHGGSLHLESVPGRGSVFSAILPLRPIEPAAEIAAVPAQDEIGPEVSDYEQDLAHLAIGTEKLTVLLVEDHEDFRFYLKENLKSSYTIVEAANGKEGWQKVLACHPQVVVSDVSMPYMDGIALCRKIKTDKRTCQIPVILLTALAAEADQLRGLKTGAADYLTKPFNFEILALKIRNLFVLNQSLKKTYSRRVKVLAPEVEVRSENEKLINKVIQYIDANLSDPKLSVEDLSKHVGVSRGTLYHRIVEITGETPIEFIRSAKLETAAKLLEKTDMRISEVGYAVGFGTPSYFAQSFKARFNVLPSEYAESRRSKLTRRENASPQY